MLADLVAGRGLDLGEAARRGVGSECPIVISCSESSHGKQVQAATGKPLFVAEKALGPGFDMFAPDQVSRLSTTRIQGLVSYPSPIHRTISLFFSDREARGAKREVR